VGSVEQYHDRFSNYIERLKMKQANARALNGIDLNVELGETLALVGESGSGKTTTGKLLVRLLEPSEGRIIFNENDITHRRGKI
jgi:ABC-type oligopeptide transport system, ATPase component